MRIFVSYSRRDNPLSRLSEIESHLRHVGNIYIDDLHYPPGVDRQVAVEATLAAADIFIAVLSVSYTRTPWTRYELSEAADRDIPLLVFTETGAVRTTQYDELAPLVYTIA
jgi:hypothetical protein